MSSRGTEFHFVIPGCLPSLNEYIAASGRRQGRHREDNDMKQGYELLITSAIHRQPKPDQFTRPVYIIYKYFEPNRRRDKDNIAAVAHKFIQDAMVNSGIIKNDGWAWIDGFEDHFDIDRENPRIEVTVRESDGD